MLSIYDSRVYLQEELERRIIYGISCEWETAVLYLTPSQRRLMQKPFFSLRDIKGTHGLWDGNRREITINRTLTLNHPWDSVREVLYHEMAHQFTEQVLNTLNEPSHGQAFLKACYYLRANPQASGNFPTLHERISDESLTSQDKMFLRIKKLMALAESQNSHEAEAAMLKAHELIAKYNIDLISANKERDFISIFAGTPSLRHSREEYQLAHLLQDFYFVYVVWIPAYVIEKSKMGRVLEINGTARNVKIASYVHDFINRFIEAQWSDYNRQKGLNRHRRSDFAVGIIRGFQSKLELQAADLRIRKEGFDLMIIEDPLMDKYIEYRYPYLRKFSRTTPIQDADILNEGRRIGETLVISKGIEEKEKSNRMLPG